MFDPKGSTNSENSLAHCICMVYAYGMHIYTYVHIMSILCLRRGHLKYVPMDHTLVADKCTYVDATCLCMVATHTPTYIQLGHTCAYWQHMYVWHTMGIHMYTHISVCMCGCACTSTHNVYVWFVHRYVWMCMHACETRPPLLTSFVAAH